ncbi:MAG: cupin domain-containing protein [Pyrinomonadaceae bacterium]
MTKLDFSYLIAPTTVTDFLGERWQKSALFIKRDEADRYRGLIEAADADAILSMADRLPAAAVDLVGAVLPSEVADRATNTQAELFGKGATIRVRAIQRFHKQLGELCRNLETEFGFPVRANLYCTPANSRGFNLHFDTHEVFVLQLLGKKKWQIFEPTMRLPLECVPPLPFETDDEAWQRARGREHSSQDIDEADVGPLVMDALLEPGDCLYLPRGFVHQADSRDEPSAHLSIGVHVLTWLDLLSVALGQTAQRHEDFRLALPAGLLAEPNNNAAEFEKEFDERLRLFAGDAAFATAVREIAESLAETRSARSSGDDYDATLVDGETKFEGNGRLRFYLAADGTMAGIAGAEKELWLPVSFAPALRFVTEQKLFSPREIPGSITENGKLAFVRHLLKDGFVRLAR